MQGLYRFRRSLLYGCDNMSIYKTVENSINKWGSTIKISNNGEIYTCKGFIQPLRYKNNMYLGGKRLDAGYFDGGHYLFIAGAGTNLSCHGDAIIENGGKKYAVKRAESFVYGDRELYLWAILKPYVPPRKEDFVYERN